MVEKGGEAEVFARLDSTRYKKRHNAEWHPARTIRRDKETNDVRHGQYLWIDYRLLTSPASNALTPAHKLALVAFVGKYGKQTEDGMRGDFQNGVVFTPADVVEFGISKSAAKTAIRTLELFGFIVKIRRGQKAEIGARAKSNTFRLSDAWKATLIAMGDSDIDQANLPVMDDPRTLPDLMHLVREMGDGCIWNQYREVATKQAFLDREHKFNPSGSKTIPSRPNPDPLQARI